MQIKPFRAVYPKLEFIASSDSFFGTVKQEYPDYKESGFFLTIDTDAYYVYQIKTPRRNYIGFVATSDVHDFNDGKILMHEDTLTSLEQVQMHLLFRRHAAVKPVLLTYPNVDDLDSLMKKITEENEPFLKIDFEIEQQTHVLWKVDNPDLQDALEKIFATKIPATYIADGHHRTSTAARMYDKFRENDGEKYRYFLTAFFSFSELEIFDYNRVVQGLNDNSPTMFMAKLSRIFDITILDEAAKPGSKHEIVMFFNHEWYLLRWRDNILNEYDESTVLLDARLLNEKVLGGILGITDVRNDRRIKYVEGPKGLEAVREIVLRNENRVGFLLYPVEWPDFLTIAETGKIMPPKTTWFEPRMKNGIIVQEISETASK